MRWIAPIMVASAMALLPSTGTADPVFPSDGSSSFSIAYTLNAASGVISASQSGSLATAPKCDGTWREAGWHNWTHVLPTTIYTIYVSTSQKTFQVNDQVPFYTFSTLYTCSGTATVASTESIDTCKYSQDIWTPPSPYTSPLSPGSGWQVQEGPPNQITAGSGQGPPPQSWDARYERMRIAFYPADSTQTVPFTGRLHFQDLSNTVFPGPPPTTNHDLFSRHYLAGKCLPALPFEDPNTRVNPGQATPEGCCNYTGSIHDMDFRSANMGFGARPFGPWRINVEFCNTGCT